MQKLIFALILLLCLVFVIGRLSEVQAVVETIQRGDWRFLLLAFAIQLFWLLTVAATYRAIYQSTGLDERLERLVLLATAANFVNVVAPSVGVGGMAVFINEARRRGYSTGRVTVAGVLYVLIDYASFLCVLALGLLVLFRRNDLTTVEVVAAIIVFIIAAGLASLLYLGTRSAQALGRVLAGIARLANRIIRPFTHREYLSEKRAYEFAHDASAGLAEVRRNHKNLLVPLSLALTSKTLLITVFLCMFLAFGVPFSLGTIIAGFSLGYLFLIVSPTPAGIGIVEGALTLGLRSLQVPLGAAAVIALAYRGFTFWFPFLFGLLSFRLLSRTQSAETPV